MARIADIQPVADRGEQIAAMEPLTITESSRHRGPISDLALELAQKAAGLKRSLPPSLIPSLATMLRSMNCYYSNLIEGHNTHPIDIERALHADYSGDAAERDLQLEAAAHVAVQRWIDEGALTGRAFSAEAIRETHRRLCEHLPPDLLTVEDPQTRERLLMVPGELRTREVMVGKHLAISPGSIPRFLARFE